MKNATIKSAVLGITLSAGVACVHAQSGASTGLNSANDIYNSYTGVTPSVGIALSNGEEFGNEIYMPANPNNNYMTNFTFEYYGTSGLGAVTNFAGNVQVDIKFYLQTGPAVNGYLSPSATPIYEWNSATADGGAFGGSSVLVASPGNYFSLQLEDFSGYAADPLSYTQGVLIPYSPYEQLTYSITFSGLGSGDTIGLGATAGPTVGVADNGYWFKPTSGSSWEYLTNGVYNTSLAEIQGVPEPTSMALVGVGALSLLVAAKRRMIK